MIEVVIYSFTQRDEVTGNCTFGACRTEDGSNVYITLPPDMSAGVNRLLDFEDPVLEVTPDQIIGGMPVPDAITKFREYGKIPPA